MLRTIFILLIRLFRILFFLLLCLINSFFGTFEKTQLQIEHFLEHLAKWHCVMPGLAPGVPIIQFYIRFLAFITA